MDRSRFTVNCSILFTELPLLDRPRAAADAGFSAVEFWWPFTVAAPAHGEVAGFVDAIASSGVVLSGLNFFAGDMAAGERGILSAPERGEEFSTNLEVVGHIAGELDCHLFNALYGNRLDGEAPEEQDTTALERLGDLERFTSSTNSTVVLEPLSGVDSYPLKSARSALDVITDLRATGSATKVRVLADLYHLAVNGENVSRSIDELGAEIGHVQIADAPGRGEPGSGEQPIASWLSQLDSVGYGGLIGLEYKPTGSSVDSFAWIEAIA